MIFQCKKCNEPFESNGLQIIAHEQTVGHICPACLANAKSVHIILVQPRPGEFEMRAIEVQKD